MSKDLILEIGTEEMPAGFVPRALASFEALLKKNIEAARLGFGSMETLGTPRRLAFIVRGLDDRQKDERVEARGPQKKAAYDAEGRPTAALIGFARAQGVDVKDVKMVDTGKGEQVVIEKLLRGRETAEILPLMLKDTVSANVFSKSMRWGNHDVSFARPVHWILSVYGGSPVAFEFGHIKSSAKTYGHRFMSGSPIEVTTADSYLDGLRKAFVIVSIEERKAMIRKALQEAASMAGGEVLSDEGLLDEVSCLVEYPVALLGSFEREFLSLPRDIIINAMREHQRYFSVVDPKGALLPHFVTVANTKAVDLNVVRKGNERVLRARLNDAKFYYEQDVKKRLSERVDALKGVVFQARLGTSYEKVERFTELALAIGSAIGFSRPREADERPADFLTENMNPSAYDPHNLDAGLYSKFVVGRSAMLAKADLTSGVVGEFPKLQGIMGSVYARRGGEAPEVATAIYEHYLPNVSGGALPASVPGAVVSIADKLDTIAGCFGVGIIPTGAQDPYALRRQALGIIAIMLDKGFRIRLDSIVDEALRLLTPKLTRKRDEARADVLEFFKDRLRHWLLGQGLSFDSIDAVLSVDWHDVNDAVKRIRALEGFRKNPACPSLVIAFKRVSNILKGIEAGAAPDEGAFNTAEERALYDASARLGPVIDAHRKAGEYEKAFEALASIKEVIDSFFDKVMVMAEDEAVRKNRLALLNSVRDLYIKTADLSRLTA